MLPEEIDELPDESEIFLHRNGIVAVVGVVNGLKRGSFKCFQRIDMCLVPFNIFSGAKFA